MQDKMIEGESPSDIQNSGFWLFLPGPSCISGPPMGWFFNPSSVSIDQYMSFCPRQLMV